MGARHVKTADSALAIGFNYDAALPPMSPIAPSVGSLQVEIFGAPRMPASHRARDQLTMILAPRSRT